MYLLNKPIIAVKDKQRYHSEINPVIITNLKMGWIEFLIVYPINLRK